MARDTSDTTPLTTRDELIAWFADGEKPRERFAIGTEHEKVPFYRDGHRPVPYAGPNGIRALLEGLARDTGWEAIEDAGHLIGLAGAEGGAISLEPGGQFELSGAPLPDIHATAAELRTHLDATARVADPLGIGFLDLGMSPKWTREETPVMPKSRYKIMAGYMPKVGGLGLDMMLRTATVQVNLDFASEADMVAKMRVALALQPVATALFANSPSPTGARTASCRAARRSGATPMPTAPACCPAPSRPASATRVMWTGCSTCRCTSSSAARPITTSPAPLSGT